MLPSKKTGYRLTRIRDTGTVVVRSIRFQVSRTLAGSIAYIVETPGRHPEPDTSAAANHPAAEPFSECHRCPVAELSPMSSDTSVRVVLIHEVLPMS